MIHRKDLFDFMLKQIKSTADKHGDHMPQAFGRWFASMFFSSITNIAITDGSGDGKVDLLVTCQVGKSVRYHILNTKFTKEYDKHSPVSFYDEITRFWQAFENRGNRSEYLSNAVKESNRILYKKLFKLYDDGDAKLYFVTNHRVNDPQNKTVANYGITIYHLDDVLQYVAEHIEGAMPETEPLILAGISNVLTPAMNESEVPTSIVFARLIDFIKYMDEDRFDLLFARNVRLWLGNTETNKAIHETFRDAPKEFAYSNNGITLLCRKQTYDPGKQELYLLNPRVVNGSQTLHSVRNADNPSKAARVMVRIIEVPPINNNDLPQQVEIRKAIIHKISIRSNLQNPIKSWNLVANDDFQNELSRFFWGKKLYYERRQYEWKSRKLDLKSVGISLGPDIRRLTQLIAAYHYNNRILGPAVAYGKLKELFEEKPYAIIRNTPPQLAYHLYLLAEISGYYLKTLGTKTNYIANVRRYIGLSAFALLCRILSESDVKIGDEALEKELEREHNNYRKDWMLPMKKLVDHIVEDYKKARSISLKKNEVELTQANYFKNSTYIGSLMKRPVPNELKRIAKLIKEEV